MSVHVVGHALQGALVSGGSATLLQNLIARELQRPGPVALSLATFVGLFRLLEDVETRETGDDSKAPFVAGLAAAAAFAVLDDKRRGSILALAAAEAAVSVADHVPAIKRIDSDLIAYLVGIAVHTQIVYTWIYRPDLYSSAQLGVLDRYSLQPKSVLEDMRTRFPMGDMASRCDVWHPHDASCLAHHIKSFVYGTPKVMKLYFPIFIVTTFLLRWKRWVHGPRPQLLQAVAQYLRTSVALKMHSQLGVLGSCLFPFANAKAATYFSGAFSTLWLLFENKKRHANALKALALYTLCTGGTWTGNHLGLTQDARRSWQYALIAMAFGAIFSHPESQNPGLMKLLYGRSFRQRSGRNQSQIPSSSVESTNRPASESIDHASSRR